MRIFLVLFAVVAISFASGTLRGAPGGEAGYTLPGTDDELDSYAYAAAEQMSTIGASFTDYAVCDDYNGIHAYLETYTTWGVTTGAVPTALEVLIIPDASGAPSTSGPSSQVSYPATLTDTGMTYGSYAIWLAVIDLSATPVEIDAPVWIGPHRNDSVSWYPIGGTTVTGSEAYRTLAAGWAWEPFSNSLVAGDLFKVLEGIPFTALERNTWAGIKNMF
ncbi:MAG: hypothetical protein KAH31_01690 [Candidatus Sabulitectum sp.]|nr:hypothetical protein [Candidatus Sabulitectum sp.]